MRLTFWIFQFGSQPGFCFFWELRSFFFSKTGVFFFWKRFHKIFFMFGVGKTFPERNVNLGLSVVCLGETSSVLALRPKTI